MTWLLDASVAIALLDRDHTAHDACRQWFVDPQVDRFATSPITQNALLRFAIRRQPELGIAHAQAALSRLCADPRHHFWLDDLEPRTLAWDGVVGHRQVTDAYLAALARTNGGRLITLDRGLAVLHDDVADLIQDTPNDS